MSKIFYESQIKSMLSELTSEKISFGKFVELLNEAVEKKLKTEKILEPSINSNKDINFRIIELDEYQVLVSKDFDEDEDDKPLLVLTVFIAGMKCTQKFGFDSEEDRNNNFNTFSSDQAIKVIDLVESLLK